MKKRFASIILTITMLLTAAMPALAVDEGIVLNQPIDEMADTENHSVSEGLDSEQLAPDLPVENRSEELAEEFNQTFETDVESDKYQESLEGMDERQTYQEQASQEENHLEDIYQDDSTAYESNENVSLASLDAEFVIKDSITRAEWIHDLCILFHMNAEEYADEYFPDITEESTYYNDIMSAVMYGMIDIEAGELFCPNDVLTRDFAVHTLNYGLGIQHEGEYTYIDIDDVANKDDAQAAIDQGWFALHEGAFLPNAAVTEAECTAILTDAQEFLNNDIANVPVSNYQFAESVVQVPETAEISAQDDIVQITGFDGISEGTVFAFYQQGFAFIYTAANVDKQGETISITTAPAPEGSVISGEFSGEITPEIDFIPEQDTITLMDSDGEPIVFGAARAVEIGKNKIRVYRNITLGDGIKGTLNVDITDIKLSTQLSGSKKFFEVTGSIAATSNVKFDLFDSDAAHIPLGSISLGAFGHVGVELQLNLEAEISYTYSADFSCGVKYEDGEFSNPVTIKSKGTTLSAEGKSSSMLALVGDFKLGILGSAYAQIGIGPTAKLSMNHYSDGTPRTCNTISAYLASNIYLEAKFIGHKAYTKTIDIFTEKNSPIRVYEHIEDGKTVYTCTRKDSSSFGYYYPKYITSANSRIYTSGNPNGSSIGIGSSGEAITVWEISLNKDGITATVTGCSGTGAVLNIPETIDGYTITAIGSNAFRRKSNIQVVKMPDSITEIGMYAFSECINLKTIEFSRSLITIEEFAFAECTSLVEVNLPEGLKDLSAGGSNGSFRECTSLQKVYIPASLEDSTKSEASFTQCSNLDNIIFGEGISKIPNGLFWGCTGLTHVDIPDTVVKIGDHSFEDCIGLTHIKIPDSVTEIDMYAFSECSNLKDIDFSKNLVTIEQFAFAECTSLVEVNLPEGLKDLSAGGSNGSFRKCTSLQKVYIPASLENSTKSEASFAQCSNLDNIIFGEGISKIPDGLFRGCTGLTYIDIPYTVIKIGSSAFAQCTELIHIKIPDFVTEIDRSAFYKCSKLRTVDFNDNLVTIGYAAFSGCTSLKEVNLPESLKELSAGNGSGAFYNCTSLQKVYIPASLANSTQSKSSFYGCSALDDIVFGKGISNIPDSLFDGCTGLTHVEIPNTVTTMGMYAFARCTNLKIVTIPDSVETYGKYSFQDCTKLTSIKLSKNALKIPDLMFSGCSTLKDIELAYGTTEIGSSAFSGCAALTNLDLPDSIRILGNRAFENCTGLVTVKTGEDLQKVSSYGFHGCTKLENIDLNEGLIEIGDNAFQETALKKVVIPNSVSKIGQYAFQKNAKLAEVLLSNRITEIPAYAFANCSALTSLVIPKSVVEIKNNAFYQDTKLTDITIPVSVTKIGDNVISYPRTTNIYGCVGSYAETWATQNNCKSFNDIMQRMTALSLANGTDHFTIGRYQTIKPVFTEVPEGNTDVISLVSDNTKAVTVKNNNFLYGANTGTANITATTSSGLTYIFTVTVGSFTGIEIGQLPTVTNYELKEDKNLDGLAVYALFKDGSKEQVYDYTVTGFDTDRLGTKSVTVTYEGKSASFDITVLHSETGTLGDALNWSFNGTSVAFSGDIPSNEYVFVAQYDADGKLMNATVLKETDKVDVSLADSIKLTRTDNVFVPECSNVTLSK